jgi:hypothetical protein
MSQSTRKAQEKKIDATIEADGDKFEDHSFSSLSRSIMQHPKDHPWEHDPTSHTGESRTLLTSEHQTEEVEPPPVEESFPRKRPKYQRRNSFVARRQHCQIQSPSIFENQSFHQSSPDRFLSPKPQKVVHVEPTPSSHIKDSWDDLAWGNTSCSNTDDTKRYDLSPIPCDFKPTIPQPLKRLPGNDEDEILKLPDVTMPSMLISSLALAGLDEKDHNIPDPLDC